MNSFAKPRSLPTRTLIDAIIIGAGPGGLSAALTLGRARRTVLLVDAGPRRNAAATHMYNFPTRDGTPPEAFRRIAREQLAAYPNVTVADVAVESLAGTRGHFDVRLSSGTVSARRVLLCTGMTDVLPEIEGFRALWGHSIFICPYCHGWEVQDQRFGYLATSEERALFPLFLRGWSHDVTLFTNGAFAISASQREQLEAGRVRVDERPIARLLASGTQLQGVALRDGTVQPLDILFAHPAQQHVALVEQLALDRTTSGHLAVDPMNAQTSTPGIYAAGDLVTAAQRALGAAASGMHAAAMLNHELTMELAAAGALP